MSDKDVDAQFADIIAHWDDVAAPPEEPAVDQAKDQAKDLPTDIPTDPAPALPADSRPGVNPPPELGFVVWRGAATDPRADDELEAGSRGTVRDDQPDDDDEEHFHPGPTAPLPPQEDLHFWGIIVGLVAGPLLLLWLVLFHPAVSGWWTLGALGLTVGGFVLLVMREPHSRDEDDPDDGARI
jgi:hypothetical protein